MPSSLLSSSPQSSLPTRVIDKHVSMRLRFRRGMLGYTQGFVARTIGVSFQQVQKYEAGINRLHAYRLYQFSRVLGVPVAYFFEGLEGEEKGPFRSLSSRSTAYYDGEVVRLRYDGGGSASESITFDLELLQKAETLRLIRHYYLIKNQALRRCIYDMCRKLGDASERG